LASVAELLGKLSSPTLVRMIFCSVVMVSYDQRATPMTCCAEASIFGTSLPRCKAAMPNTFMKRSTAPAGRPENLIKQHNTQLSSDRTSCRSPLANQMRLILHTGAYWLLNSN
jgi:hypothetical protein